MPTANLQRVSAHTFPVIGPEVKTMGNWVDPAYASAPLPHSQGTHGSYDDAHKERLFSGSNVKSDSKDCLISAKSDNQVNHMINYKPSASVPKYELPGFGQPSVQYESRTDAFKNVQPGSRLASTSSQSGSTWVRTLKVPSRGESSYEVAKTAGSNKIFVVMPSKDTQSHMKFNSEVTRDPLARGSNHGSISSQVSHQYTPSKGSQSTSKLQTAGSSYGPFMKRIPVYSSMNPRKPSRSGFTYTEAKPSVVGSGPIFVVQGGGNAQGLGGYSGHPDSVKPLGGPSYVDPYRASQISSLTESSQGKSWNKPLRYMSGTQYSPSSEPRKPSKNDCRDNDARSSIVSSGGNLLNAPESALIKKIPHYDATLPKFQQTYNIHGQRNQIFKPVYSSQSGAQRDVAKSPIASSGGILLKAPESAQIKKILPHYDATHPKFQQTYNIHGQRNQIFKPVYSSQSGAQRDVAKSPFASSGAILMMQAPANVQNRAESNKPKVHPSFPERKVPFTPGQTAHQYRSGYQAFSSLKGTPYKPSSVPSRHSTSKLGFSTFNPTIAGSNEINTVHVRLNKLPTSSFGSFQNQWASSDISSGAFQSSLPPSYPSQRPGQHVQKPVRSSSRCSKGVQSQDGTRCVTAIPSEFGQGTIRRISPTLSSSYRQGNHFIITLHV